MHRLILPLALLMVLNSVAEAGRVWWTATGTVTSSRGDGLGPLANVDDPVEIEFSYEDGAPTVPIIDIPETWTEVEFRDGVDLDVRVTIGENTWQGTIASGSGNSPRTLEVRDTNVWPTDSASTDRFIARASQADGAAYPSFPGGTPGAATSIELKFEDGSEGQDGADYLGSGRLPCVSQSITRITSASGFVRNSVTERISFSIDLASIRTELLGVNVLPLKSISVDRPAELVTLVWPTQPGTFYVVQYLDEFLCWREHFSVLADEEETTETFFPAVVPFPDKQLYRVIEEE